METTDILIIYFIIVLILYIILCKSGIRGASSFIISLIVGQFSLIFSMMPHLIEEESASIYAIYMLIQFGTVFSVYIYALSEAFNDSSSEYISFHINSPRKNPRIQISEYLS
jgi:hypothetical protein